MVCRVLVSLGIGLLGAGAVLADGVRGYAEFTLSNFDSRREDEPGQLTATETDAWRQRYSLDLDKLLFPNLTLRAGGFFERDATTLATDSTETSGTVTRTRPYFSLALRLPLHVVEVSYDRSEQRQRTNGGASFSDVRETYSATLAYMPPDLPRVRFEYLHTNAFDKARQTQDTSEDRFQLSSDYAPTRAVQLQYRGSLEDSKDRLNETEVQSWAHSGRVTYFDSFWDQRVRVSSDYNYSYNSIETTTSGSGVVGFPLLLVAGLSSINDLPELGTLAPNPALTDGELGVGAGVNLLLPESGGDDDPRNVGLQFAGPAALNTLLVRVDRDLSDVFDRFSWDVYVSDDNEEWREWAAHDDPDAGRRPIVSFERFLLRFEIEFPEVNTEFVKLVVSPVRPSALLPETFPSIGVTELQAELRRPASDVGRKDSGTAQALNLQMRTRLHQGPSVYHDISYFLSKNDPNPTAYTLSNGLSLDHAFNRAYRVTARLAREDGRQSGMDRTALSFGTSLIASAVDNLRHRLVFSARNIDERGESRDSRSVFLHNTARLYRGVDVDLGLGKSFAERSTTGKTEGYEINARATLVPHRSTTVNLGYRNRSDEVAQGPDLPGSRRFTRSGEASVAYSPLVGLYLFGSYRIERRTNVDERTIGNYSINWSPFRDGTLQLGIYFNERLRSEDDAEERTLSPLLRWNFRRGSFLDVSYQKLTIRAITQRVDNEVLSSNLRFAF